MESGTAYIIGQRDPVQTLVVGDTRGDHMDTDLCAVLAELTSLQIAVTNRDYVPDHDGVVAAVTKIQMAMDILRGIMTPGHQCDGTPRSEYAF